jgi:hypothetical protein
VVEDTLIDNQVLKASLLIRASENLWVEQVPLLSNLSNPILAFLKFRQESKQDAISILRAHAERLCDIRDVGKRS